MVGMRMRVQNPDQIYSAVAHIGQQTLGVPCRGRAGKRVEIKHGVNNGPFHGFGIVKDILPAAGRFIPEAFYNRIGHLAFPSCCRPAGGHARRHGRK